MADLVIVDTDILIDAGRGIDQAVACLKQIQDQRGLAVSVITQLELIVGCRSKRELASAALHRLIHMQGLITCNSTVEQMMPAPGCGMVKQDPNCSHWPTCP